MFKSKILIFFGLTMLILFSLSAGSLALFTSEAISSSNTITTGTMYIGNEAGEKGILDRCITVEKMIPGAEPQKVTIKIKNLGSMTAYLKGISANITEGNEKFIANAIHACCLDKNGRELYKGSLLALDGNVVPFQHVVSLEAGETTELDLLLQLDERAGNWYKGKKLEMSFSVYAFQRADQITDPKTKLAMANSVQASLDEANAGDVVLIPAGDYETLLVKPGVTVKALDVVFDSTVKGFHIEQKGPANKQNNGVKKESLTNQATSIQGFTIKEDGVKVQGGKSCEITDNIFISPEANIVNRSGSKVSVTRNDLVGFDEDGIGESNARQEKNFKKIYQGNITAQYNLGDDLNSEEHAL